MQWPKIIIECNSLTIIKKCKAKRQDKSQKKEEIYLLGNVPETRKNMIECKNQT
ncbi:hypothetical protein Goari_001015, partial [Gossypium aridum]|nr:hypothetical protein [Gossypium aridum]